jgi:predicted MFS family arabinose efflux permease
MGAFYVESAVTGGVSPRVAGTLLALGSACGIAGRFLFSWRLGQVSQPYVIVAALIGLGGLGAIAFAVHSQGIVLIAGTVLAFGAGWGWNGLLTQTVVVSHPEAPARASAYIVVGAAAGGVIGPTLFGFVVGHLGYRVAWSVCAAQFLTAATVLFLLCGRKGAGQVTTAAPVTAAVPVPPGPR